MKNFKPTYTIAFWVIVVCAFIAGCSSQKNTVTNRALQNLSARYNLIYNSNVLLDEYQDNLLATIKNDYDRILPIYYAPYADFNASTPDSKELNDISKKAQNVVADKNLSNYVDEAYILIGKTNFYKGSYFNAYEYFTYVAQTYKTNTDIYLNAINWKARTLIQLEKDKDALSLLDTLSDTLDVVKHKKAEPFATLAQMSIYQKDYPKAIVYLENAVKETSKQANKIRWNYILGQLNEGIKDYKTSLKYFSKVEKSNAPFEMYFNAELGKIRVTDLLNNHKTSRQKQLLTLLRDDKNIEFTDQIYYEVAEDFLANGNYPKAEEYYKISAQKSTVNQNQKGLSYLKIADLNFKELGDYINAKLYYDSALAVLPKNYPNYDILVKKSENLEYLTKRYETIKLEDTLQKISLLPESDRSKALIAYFKPAPNAFATDQATTDASTAIKLNNGSSTLPNSTVATTDGTFYFANSTAISRGFNDFKKRWGNRKLEDNWRQSLKSSAQNTQQAQAKSDAGTIGLPTNPDAIIQRPVIDNDKALSYLDSIPVTQVQKDKSNQKIILSYLDIASFYLQVLNDNNEAIKTYELLLNRFPKNSYLDIIYYSLYLGYKDIDKQKSNEYRALVLRDYPTSIYAKTILDPSFSLKQNALEEIVQKQYNLIFESFEKKDFAQVITAVDAINSRFPGNILESQFTYLKAIAIGRTQNVDSLMNALKGIVAKYPTDLLIKPVAVDNIAYLTAHYGDFKKRNIALVDFDPNEPRFIATTSAVATPNPTVVLPVVTSVAKTEKVVAKKEEDKTVAVKPPDIAIDPVKLIDTATQVAKKESLKIIAPPVVETLFSTAKSTLYYAVIVVNRTDMSVSSSRFGIGQFDRGNYSGSNLRHNLKNLGEDQLIYVGDFATYNDSKNYELAITPQLGQIMKVPPTNYSTFVISKENLDKITDRSTLTRYQNFIKNNEQQNK